MVKHEIEISLKISKLSYFYKFLPQYKVED